MDTRQEPDLSPFWSVVPPRTKAKSAKRFSSLPITIFSLCWYYNDIFVKCQTATCALLICTPGMIWDNRTVQFQIILSCMDNDPCSLKKVSSESDNILLGTTTVQRFYEDRPFPFYTPQLESRSDSPMGNHFFTILSTHQTYLAGSIRNQICFHSQFFWDNCL